MAKEVPQGVKISLRATLLSSTKGIKQTSVEKDYYKLTNSKLDVKKYGYQDLYEFLLAVPDVARLEFSVKDGENKVFGVSEKGVFISQHAKKAEGVPNGLKPLPPSEWPRNKKTSKPKDRTVVEDKASLKVTVESDDKTKILPNGRGLYALHVANLPQNCQQSEVSRIFKQFKSLREVKIENPNRFAFLRFSNHADAARALSDINGYNLQGSVLKISPAIERGPLQNAKSRKNKKDEPKVDTTTKNKKTTIENGFASKDAVVKDLKPGSSVNSKSPLSSPREMKTAMPKESWELTDNALSPKMATVENKKFFYQGNFVTCINEEEGGFPVHVSNFPVGTRQESLKEIFSVHGKIVQIKMQEKFAFIFFAKQEGAIAALEKMKDTKLGDKKLTITPKLQKGKAKQQNLSVSPTRLSHTSSQSSVSGFDSMKPQSPVHNSYSDAACGLGTSKKEHSGVTVNGYIGSCESSARQSQGSGSITSNNSNSIYEQKLEDSKSVSSSRTSIENGCSSLDTKPEISASVKGKGLGHILLTNVEMCELFARCKKPLRTMANIGAQEFEVLVTDVVDSCHFWANTDDKSGSYKELVQIRTDLQIVEHYKRCMPVKYQLGAAVFSEDKLWYRCWCLEVSKVEQKLAKVFYIDYGNCEWISWDQFTDIHKRFWDLAPQAVPFKLAGLEVASDVSPEILSEGSIYLSALIINRVCKARICQSSNPKKPHVIEVELIVTDDNGSEIHVNKQMALTRYALETRKPSHAVQASVQNQLNIESNPTPLAQPQQPVKQAPPRPLSLSPQIAQGTQAAVPFSNFVQKLVDQKSPPSNYSEQSPQLPGSSQTKFAKEFVQSPQSVHKIGQHPTLNQNVEPVEKSPPKTLQNQQQFPSYQLFEKREVMDVVLSTVYSPDAIYFYKVDEKTLELLKYTKKVLHTEINPTAKIYPRVGDIVTLLQESGKTFRVRIKSIPPNAAFGVDKVNVQSVDYGWSYTVPLSSLCELPQKLKNLAPQVILAKLAGLQRKPCLLGYPETAVRKLFDIKASRQVVQASVVKRQEDGVLLVELFESGGPSVNVQLLKMPGIQLDESQRSLFCSNFTSPGSNTSSLSPPGSTNNLHIASNQYSRWPPVENSMDLHHADNQSVHSDWEDSLIETEPHWIETVPVPGAHTSGSGRQSLDNLYVPPPPEVYPSSLLGLPSTVPLGTRSPSVASSASSESFNVRPPFSEVSVSSLPRDRRTPSSSGSESSDSHAAVKALQSALHELSATESECTSNGEQQNSVDKERLKQEDPQGWRQQREELIQKEKELKRTLEMPRSEVMKMLSLEQEKEKLERKIRIKGLENQILKLCKELKQLELEKGALEEELG